MVLIESNFLTNSKIIEKNHQAPIKGRKVDNKDVRSIQKVDGFLYEVKFVDGTNERFTGDDSLVLVIPEEYQDLVFSLIGQTYAKVVG